VNISSGYQRLGGLVSLLNDSNASVIVALHQAPQFTHPNTTSFDTLPDDPKSAGLIGHALANFLSVYPNVIGLQFWVYVSDADTWGPRPAHYVDCLREFYLGVKNSSRPVPVYFSEVNGIQYINGTASHPSRPAC
jgi:hypothetical protein